MPEDTQAQEPKANPNAANPNTKASDKADPGTGDTAEDSAANHNAQVAPPEPKERSLTEGGVAGKPAEEAPAKATAGKAAGDKPAAKPAAAKAAGDKPAAKPAKEKPPALEDKPFQEFITQHFLPGLTKTMETLGITDLNLAFDHKPLPIKGMESTECWQVVGTFQSGQRQFMVAFLKDDLQSPKVFSCADNGSQFSLLESFMIDERKVTLDLLLLYTVQRLNGQKWLTLN